MKHQAQIITWTKYATKEMEKCYFSNVEKQEPRAHTLVISQTSKSKNQSLKANQWEKKLSSSSNETHGHYFTAKKSKSLNSSVAIARYNDSGQLRTTN